MLSMGGLYSMKAIAVLTKITQVCFMILNNIRELMKKLPFSPLRSILECNLCNCKAELCLKIKLPVHKRPV